jgi:HD domain
VNPRQWSQRLDPAVPVVAGAAGVVVLALWFARDDVDGLSAVWVHLAVFAVAIAMGETARLTILTGRATAPISTAASFGLGFSALVPEQQVPVGPAVLVSTIGLGMLAGQLALQLARRPAQWGAFSARLVATALVPVLYSQVLFAGHSLIEWQATWAGRRWLVAVVMLLVGSLAMLVDLCLEATISAARDHAPWLRTVVDEVRSAAGLATALVTSGPLIALAEYALGLWALPLFLFPLVLTYFAVQRFANVRATYRQTIGALSLLTERTGYTVSDHAHRVSETAVAIGRDLGLAQRELTDLEYAALLHDLGQIALREPIPGGATLMAAPADQQRIAHDGAEIVRSTGVLDNVADILEAQTTPFRQVRELGQELPMSSRIIKVVNAYEDLCGPDGVGDERAMERIHLGLGYEYDPRVVDSLTKVMERRRRVAPQSASL